MKKKNKIIIAASCFVVSMVLYYIGQTRSDYYDVTSSNIDAIVRTTGGDNVRYNGYLYQPVYLDEYDSDGIEGGSSKHYDIEGDRRYVIVNGVKEWECSDYVYTSPKANPPICYRFIIGR